MNATLSKFFVLAAACSLTACAAHAGSLRGDGSGSDDGSNASGLDAGAGSGSSELPPPPPGMLYGTVLDERNDQIDFSTGEPVHTHGGAPIDLGADGCPPVYKYAYLEDQSDPRFGSQTTANPLAWHVTSQVGSLDDSATAYRVRADDGTVLLDWSPTSPDATGLYTVQLHRYGTPALPALGDRTGTMYVDVRFRDTSGNETVDTACWENHPMAAPLEVTQLAPSSFLGWTLPANSPISTAIDDASFEEYGTGADVLAQELVQHTAEPVTVHVAHSGMTGTSSETDLQETVATAVSDDPVACSSAIVYPCAKPALVAAPHTQSGAFSARWLLRVVDETTNAIVCHNSTALADLTDTIDDCVIPARTAAEAPHRYRLVLSMYAADTLAWNSVANYGEYTAGALTYTGTVPIANAVSGCTKVMNRVLDGNEVSDCEETTTYALVDALDKAYIDFDPISLAVTTAPDATAALEALPYVSTQLSAGALAWDAGDKGLLP